MALPERQRRKLMTIPDWCQAPADPLWKIIEKLPIVDYIRFGVVCRVWRTVLAEKRHPPSPQPPWVFLLDQEFGRHITGARNSTLRFFSLSDKKEYHLSMPGIFGALICLGSSHGWMFFVQLRSLSSEISMFNPMTRANVFLPSIDTLPVSAQKNPNIRPNMDIKVVISQSPSIVAAAIQFEATSLSFAKLRYKSWITIKTPSYTHYCDIIFYKEKLCGLTKSGAVVSCDLADAHDPKVSLVVRPPEFSINNNPNLRLYQYLVECSGDLLLVMRGVERQEKTMRVNVLKMDHDCKWVRVESIDDHAIFLGHSPSLAFCPEKFLMLRRNCIYLANVSDLLTFGNIFTGYPAPDTQLYNTQDGSFEQLRCSLKTTHVPAFWFTPNL